MLLYHLVYPFMPRPEGDKAWKLAAYYRYLEAQG